MLAAGFAPFPAASLMIPIQEIIIWNAEDAKEKEIKKDEGRIF